MLYKKNVEKSLKKELFKNPTFEFRGTPFWALNSYLTKEEMWSCRCTCDKGRKIQWYQ